MFWNLCLQQVRRTIISSRFLISLLLVIGFSLPELLGLRAMANHFHETIHLGFFVFFLSNSFRIMVLFVALALLFAPLPDRSEQQMQLILRTGKRIWLLAYLVAIVISLLVFLLCYLLFLEVMLVGHLRFDSRWGKILGSLGQQPQFGLPFELTLKYDYYIQSQLNPWTAIWRQLLVLLPITSLFALGAFLLNLIQDRLGTFFVSTLISVQLLGGYIQEFDFYRITVLSWVGLVNIANEQNAALPSLSYIGLCLAGFAIFLAGLLAYFLSHHYRIQY